MADDAPRQPASAPIDGAAITELLRVAAPAVVSMLSFSLMQFVDRLLTARLIGPEALAAVGNGGIASWVAGSVFMGLLGVINTYVSQHLGAGRPERGPAYAWTGFWLSLGAWAFVLLPYAVFFPHVFGFMRAALDLPTVSEHVRAMEGIYGRTVLMGLLFSLCARAAGHYFYGMHRAGIVMASTITGNIVNVALTWALIMWAKSFADLGNLGVERLAVQGAAIGTVVGALVEAAIPAAIFLSAKYHRLYGTRSAWKPSARHFRDILRIGWPGAVMFGNEMVCWWIFMGGFVASFDKGESLAVHSPAGWITHQYMMLSFMPAVGISIAATAVVGRCIGAGRHDLAQARTWLAVWLTLAYMGACAAAFVLFGEPMARLFIPAHATPEQAERIIQLARWMLILAAAFQLFDGLAITLSGALRGAGDTVWPGVATIILSWGVIVVGGWVAVKHLPRLESLGPWAAASLYIILLAMVLLWRFQAGHWKRIRVIDRTRGEAVEGGVPILASDPGPGDIAMAPALDIPALAGQEAVPVDPPRGVEPDRGAT